MVGANLTRSPWGTFNMCRLSKQDPAFAVQNDRRQVPVRAQQRIQLRLQSGHVRDTGQSLENALC